LLQNLLKEFNNPCSLIALDILPEHPTILKQDFLTYTIKSNKPLQIGFISNIPFGKNNSLSRSFIKHCCSQAFPSSEESIIAFILPKSYLKESMNQCFSPEWHLVRTMELPFNNFYYNNKEFNVPTIFSI
jgi:hypothetical protein